MLVTSIFSFSHNVHTLPKTNFKISATSNLSSANVFNLDQSENLLFGKELSFQYIHTMYYSHYISKSVGCRFFKYKVSFMTFVASVACVDQDQATQNM